MSEIVLDLSRLSDSEKKRAVWRRVHILNAAETKLASRLAREYCLYSDGITRRRSLSDLKRRYRRIDARLSGAFNELHALISNKGALS